MNRETRRPRPQKHEPQKPSVPKESGFTREDLRRDTYVPSRDTTDSPRPQESANRQYC